MDYPSVAIVVLNLNGWQDAIRCLESLYQITYPNYDVILMENGSEDDSVEKIKEWAQGKIPAEGKFLKYDPEGKPISYIEYTRVEAEAGGGKEKEIRQLPSNKKLIFIKNERNYGFTKGNNIAMRYALDVLNSEYTLLLHHDCIVSPHFLDELITIANKEPSAGILGSKVYLGETNEVVYAEGGLMDYWRLTGITRGPKLSALAEGKDAVPMDFVCTISALLSRKMCQTIGLLDEDFFYGLDETELGIRATKHGFKVLYVPKSEIWHVQGHSAVDEERRRMLYYHVPKDQFILMWKHWSKLQFVVASLFFFTNHLLHLPGFLIHSRDWGVFKLTFRGLLDFVKERNSYRRVKP